MKELRYTLISDGSSDAALIPVLTWLLRAQGVATAIQPRWADLDRVNMPKKPKLSDKIASGLRLYPCELLFVHRDAEREPREKRVEEIGAAVEAVVQNVQILPPAVCVVPVRMQGAWLLFDEEAIKHAAGNRNYKKPLYLPPIKQLETLSDPKTILYNGLKQVSGLSGRRLHRFPVRRRARRISEFIEDFSPLRALPAFAALEEDTRTIVVDRGWALPPS